MADSNTDPNVDPTTGLPIDMTNNPPVVPGPSNSSGGGLLGMLTQALGITNPNTATAIGQLLGIGGQAGAAALDQAHISDAINYLKSIGGTASGQQSQNNQFGVNAFGNQNNVINSIFSGQNPYSQLLGNTVGNISQLNSMIANPTSGLMSGNLLWQDPTATSALGTAGDNVGALEQLMAHAGNLVSAGGQTGLNSGIANTAMGLAGMQNPLLSTGQAASFAANQAGQNMANAAQTAREQAANRGGGAGATVANGTGNQAMADFANQGNAATSNALQNALLNQQGLNLQQVFGGLNAGQGAAALQQSLLNTGIQGGLGSANSANSALQNAINQIMAGRTGAAGIGSTQAGLLQGQNAQNANIANSGLQALLSGAGLSGQQGSSFLNNAANLMSTYANTGGSIAKMLAQSPWSTFLSGLGGFAKPSSGGNTNLSFNLGGLLGGNGSNGNSGGNLGGDLFNLFSGGNSGSSEWGGGSSIGGNGAGQLLIN